jgi:hypothetical protein
MAREREREREVELGLAKGTDEWVMGASGILEHAQV